jgi:hypothetical protein
VQVQIAARAVAAENEYLKGVLQSHGISYHPRASVGDQTDTCSDIDGVSGAEHRSVSCTPFEIAHDCISQGPTLYPHSSSSDGISQHIDAAVESFPFAIDPAMISQTLNEEEFLRLVSSAQYPIDPGPEAPLATGSCSSSLVPSLCGGGYLPPIKDTSSTTPCTVAFSIISILNSRRSNPIEQSALRSEMLKGFYSGPDHDWEGCRLDNMIFIATITKLLC